MGDLLQMIMSNYGIMSKLACKQAHRWAGKKTKAWFTCSTQMQIQAQMQVQMQAMFTHNANASDLTHAHSFSSCLPCLHLHLRLRCSHMKQAQMQVQEKGKFSFFLALAFAFTHSIACICTCICVARVNQAFNWLHGGKETRLSQPQFLFIYLFNLNLFLPFWPVAWCNATMVESSSRTSLTSIQQSTISWRNNPRRLLTVEVVIFLYVTGIILEIPVMQQYLYDKARDELKVTDTDQNDTVCDSHYENSSEYRYNNY